MNAKELKDFIIDDDDKIFKLLESIDCHKIWKTGDEIRCALPELDNHTAVVVHLDNLNCNIYRSGDTFSGDIISLVQEIKGFDSFKTTFNYIKNLFGISSNYSPEESPKIDLLSKFKGIRKEHNNIFGIDSVKIPYFDKSILSSYYRVTHINLFLEGILPSTAKLFDVGLDVKKNRITFPHFAYDNTNHIVGITGRTLASNTEIKEFMIPKYWNYIKGYKKMYNLYGFSHSIENAIKTGLMIIFEAEKSVLKNFSQTGDKGYSCSVGGHELSFQQVQILLRYLPPEVEIVIAFDKDVMNMKDKKTHEDIGEDFLRNTCEKIARYHKVSYILDKNNLLDETDSPIDKGIQVFNKLLEDRIKYN